MKFLITGGSGFIGSAVIRNLINTSEHEVLNVDKLTYASAKGALRSIENSPNYKFCNIDICNLVKLKEVFESYQPDIVMHLAAESHVDRSILSPIDFINTNVVGTFNLLETSLSYWQKISSEKRKIFRFHHISTDEVFGDLPIDAAPFSETTAYAPSSPYSASKASSDHLVNSWHRTFGLPIVLSNCSNNYGAYQHPEKLIPTVITNALSGKPIPVFGNGQQIRDWIYVDDHAEALINIALNAQSGQRYNVGGNSECKNIDVITQICSILNNTNLITQDKKNDFFDLIEYVTDRPGHDLRYAIDSKKIEKDLSWSPKYSFEFGLKETVLWYIKNHWWWADYKSNETVLQEAKK